MASGAAEGATTMRWKVRLLGGTNGSFQKESERVSQGAQ